MTSQALVLSEGTLYYPSSSTPSGLTGADIAAVAREHPTAALLDDPALLDLITPGTVAEATGAILMMLYQFPGHEAEVGGRLWDMVRDTMDMSEEAFLPQFGLLSARARLIRRSATLPAASLHKAVKHLASSAHFFAPVAVGLAAAALESLGYLGALSEQPAVGTVSREVTVWFLSGATWCHEDASDEPRGNGPWSRRQAIASGVCIAGLVVLWAASDKAEMVTPAVVEGTAQTVSQMVLKALRKAGGALQDVGERLWAMVKSTMAMTKDAFDRLFERLASTARSFRSGAAQTATQVWAAAKHLARQVAFFAPVIVGLASAVLAVEWSVGGSASAQKYSPVHLARRGVMAWYREGREAPCALYLSQSGLGSAGWMGWDAAEEKEVFVGAAASAAAAALMAAGVSSGVSAALGGLAAMALGTTACVSLAPAALMVGAGGLVYGFCRGAREGHAVAAEEVKARVVARVCSPKQR